MTTGRTSSDGHTSYRYVVGQTTYYAQTPHPSSVFNSIAFHVFSYFHKPLRFPDAPRSNQIHSKLICYFHLDQFTMVRKLFPLLFLAACSTSAFTPSSTVSRIRLDLQVVEPMPSTDDSPVKTDENLLDLPPVLQQIADERRSFQLNLGKAMDTLRKDMPYILKRAPGTYSESSDSCDPPGITRQPSFTFTSNPPLL